ncbi:cytochrome c-type biogenesis protein CcmH [Rhizobium sp. SG_E_25_P2]|uniref:cytochrome c-type biogenesis protein n=1 Tax=Rhizobium sp. SG_E_25_P2 TaxID=2879942 RepID=UPI00247500F8|nr:cytochrome c-type biogenesis protein CcmH [Rhizobium sp. SG_E_25_P2]MDH6268343.1 cytochrome c-type biogenesis protein CcmH [Rhizobium sp. SG_E_25_P2]
MRKLLAILLFLMSAAPAFAVNPDEVLKDPALEARARELSAQLRCMVCQNQSIDDSNADLAKDLRLLVRERLTAGDSDDEVIEYLVSRYGEFVLLKPRLSEHTILLWGMPAALAAIGAGVVLIQLRRKRISSPTQDLSDDEQRKLDALLKGRD